VHSVHSVHSECVCAKALGDLNQAYQCLRLALSLNNEHGDAYNQLGVLELQRCNAEIARAFFLAAISIAPHLYEAHANLAVLSEQVALLSSLHSLHSSLSSLHSSLAEQQSSTTLSHSSRIAN